MKKVIYVEIDEEVTSIYDRVKRAKQKIIYLVVPKKAIIFHSAVNLQILDRKLKELGKKLIIITTDHMGKKIAERVGLDVYSKIEIEEVKAPNEEGPETRIQPMQARRNEVIKEAPKRSIGKKITIRELISEFRMKDKKKKKKATEESVSLSFVRPNRKFLVFIIVLSLGLFMLISYIALPGATIYIKPKFDNIDHTVNIVLADKRKNQNLLSQNKPNVIASEVISIETKQTKVFNTTSKEFEGVNAKGKIKIINTSEEEWPLKAKTRFQTEDGIIFRIDKGVIVPPLTFEEIEIPVEIDEAEVLDGTLDEEKEPDSAGVSDEAAEDEAEEEASPPKQTEFKKVSGELIVSVEADPFDIYDEPVGDSGNISPTTFTIPGLSKYNQRLIWGISEEQMTGGVTNYYKVVKEEDIESAKKQINDNLILMAKEDLRTRIDEVNKLNHTNLVLLDDRRYLKTKLLDLRISEDLEGSRKEKFEVFAKISAQGVAYNFEQLYALLGKELKTRTHPDMRIREDSISPDTITYEVIDEDEDLGQIKITATIKGIEEYVIEPTEEAGIRFGRKAKDKILSLDIEEAESIINNFPEVDEVTIKTWPIWLSKMPRIPENIEIKLMGE